MRDNVALFTRHSLAEPYTQNDPCCYFDFILITRNGITMSPDFMATLNDPYILVYVLYFNI